VQGAALARERDARPRRCAPRHAQKLTGHLLGRRLTLGLGERPRVVERAPRASLVVRQRRRVEGYARAVERERHGHARVVRTRASCSETRVERKQTTPPKYTWLVSRAFPQRVIFTRNIPHSFEREDTGMMRDDTTPPVVEKMSRASDVMPQEDALAYASKLTPSQRMDVGGCYLVRCVPCGLCPVGLHYVCGGSALCWGCGTTPFACCSLPMPFVDPYFRSPKRDFTVVVVDAAKQTMACYPGERARDPCCVWHKLI